MSDGDGASDAETAARSTPAGASTEPSESTAESTPGPEPSSSAADVDDDPDTGRPDPTDIDVDELIGPERRLNPKVRYVWVLQSAISALVLGVMTGLPAFFVFDRVVVGPAVFTVLFVVGAVLAVYRYRRWSYEVREDSLFLDRGVVTQTRTVVPYVRIQHVDASRGPVERAFGLATAVVYTAGSRGADVSIPGLTPERADDLQERLKRLAIAAEGEDAV